MPTPPLQNNTALETTLKSFLCCFPVLFFLLLLLNFRTLPVGSKSWVLLQRSTFCFLSAGDSLLRMLPCLGHRKAQNPQPRAQGSCLSAHTNLTQLCLPTRNSDENLGIEFALKIYSQAEFKGENDLPCNLWERIQGSRTLLVTSRIGNTLFITQHQPIFYLKSQINLMGKKRKKKKKPPEILSLPANSKYLSMAKLKI